MPAPVTARGWDVLVPVKVLATAKSRLTGIGPAARGRLALAFACDVVLAARSCEQVRRVVVVTRDGHAATSLRALGAEVVDEPSAGGLNAALAHADALLRTDAHADFGAGTAGAADLTGQSARTAAAGGGVALGRTGVAALSADLPALRADELAAVLQRAAAHGRALVVDADDDGTAVLLVTDGSPLDPRYGPGSNRRHRAAGAVEVVAAAGVRRDVDTAAHLQQALRLGVGPHTRRAVRGPG